MPFYNSKTYCSDLRMAAMSSVGMEELKGCSILITGATGTIGSFLTDVILQYAADENTDISVTAAGRSKRRIEELFEGAPAPVGFVHYDLKEKPDFSGHFDYIIAAAGNSHPAAFNGDPVGTLVGGVAGTYELLEYGRTHGARRLLFLSSGEVYGLGDKTLDSFREDYAGYLDPASPRSAYPMSKRAAENLCAAYTAQYGFSTVMVRPCHTYGPHITATDSRANAQFLKSGAAIDPIVLKSEGRQLRSYAYVADCASAILSVLVAGEDGQVYNSATRGARATIAQFAEVVARESGTKVVYQKPTKEERDNRSPIQKQVLSSEKTEALGWRGHFSVTRGVTHCLKVMNGE